MVRLAVHYFIAFIVLTVYGGQVCPFVESLTLVEWGSTTLVLFTATFVVNLFVYIKYVKPKITLASDKAFKVVFSIFILSGFFIAFYNYFINGFPVASGFKLIIGWLMVGFFMALDMTLVNKEIITLHLAKTGQHLEISASYSSLTKKFLVFAILTSITILLVIYLVVIKDLDWIFTANPDPKEATISVLKEFAFIFAVIFGYSALIAISFTKNLKLYLCYQNTALEKVIHGDFNASVPVSTIDEFGQMARYTNKMITSLKDRTETLQLTQDVTILTLASVAETRDNETGAHIMRTQRYVKAVAEYLSKNGMAQELTPEIIDLMYKSAPLHDVGKVGIPDSILLKPGKLTDDEFKIMKRHPAYGKKALATAGNALGKNSFLRIAEEIAFTHHEKWDGSGYPRMLKGEEIPISGRIMAVADVYDALISARVYKPAFSHEKAKGIIVEGSGIHFDPMIVEAFLALEDEFVSIAKEYSDENYNSSISIDNINLES
jgi:HD-GYP domain-containing protein (c-di-GMP phosphodiesterase class II)